MRTLGLAALVAMLCCACGAGPSIRPDVAVVERQDDSPVGTPDPAETAPPELPLPVHDLDWRDCTTDTVTDLALPPGPAGMVIDCADLAAPVDPDNPMRGSFALGLTRARLAQTPTDVAPLLLTTGSDDTARAALGALATGPVTALLSTRPVVAVDRRGIGQSTAIVCMDSSSTMPRQAMLDLGQFSPPPTAGGDAADTVLALGRDATTACTDFLQPHQLSFDAASAADDLDQVRRAWGVDSIGVLATGSGVDVALAYAAQHPQAVGRLVLDSPSVARSDATTTAEAAVRGREAALAAFARQCAALQCALGADPRTAVSDLVDRARRGELGSVSANALLVTLTDFLGSPRTDVQTGIRDFADALAAAANGDPATLQPRIDAAAARIRSDGQFVARCSDGTQWPTPGRVRELQTQWGERYPVFGPEAALELLLCASWPTTPPPDAPQSAIAPTLTIGSGSDPVAGDGSASATGTLAAIGTPTATITWLGAGHPALTHSECVQRAVAGYASTGVLPPDGGACPG